MAHLVRRKNLLYVKFRRPDGSWGRVSTGYRVGQEPHAQAFMTEFVASGEKPDRLDLDGPLALPTAATTVWDFGRVFLVERRSRGILDWGHEEAHLRFHLHELRDRALRDVTKGETLTWARSLAGKTGEHGKPLAAATIKKITSTVKMLFKEAVKRDLIAVTPCVWDAADLPRKTTSSRSREGGFTAEDVARFMYDERVPEDRRVLYAMEFLTGMRTGEAAIRRWKDWEPKFKGDLGRLVAATAYSTEHRIEKGTKTEIEKWLPVHPALHELLVAWKREGWSRMFGRTPGPDDLIVPGEKGGPRNNGNSWARWARDLEALGVAHQRHYESRSTFRSLAMAGGADERDVERLTHPSPKGASDLYTRTGMIWPRLCRAVECIRIERPMVTVGESVVVTPPGLRLAVGAGNPTEPHDDPPKGGGAGKTAGQGNRTPQKRLSAPLTGFEDRARHQPGTSRRRPVYPCHLARSRERRGSCYRGAFEGRSAAAGAACSSPHGARRSAESSCGMARRRTRKYCMGE